MSEFDEILAVHKPKCFWIEEVPTFAETRLAILNDRTPLEVASEKWSRRGYAVNGVEIHHEDFIDVSRVRCFVFGMGSECGHQRGADWALAFLNEAVAIRKMAPPVAVWSVIDPQGLEERKRRAGCKAFPSCSNRMFLFLVKQVCLSLLVVLVIDVGHPCTLKARGSVKLLFRGNVKWHYVSSIDFR